ncbi:hypothetical protein SAMN04487894_101220 [Niabella drilacis]|uniref:Integrase n=1 Tax=Niabella drilacis (strain DSM 25811 / CCM 8410 / CCUG 62505 / LMG 26954 / E90) TaxID=1285928 RepID=A0A1G6IH65_NIADE|nr:hypothetical protein SAMN04487894_101220 [Niabella drilacis]
MKYYLNTLYYAHIRAVGPLVCNALMLGIALQVVMKRTGHSNYKSMKPYIDVSDQAKAEAIKLFDRQVSLFWSPELIVI